jgi:hypothetical protein
MSNELKEKFEKVFDKIKEPFEKYSSSDKNKQNIYTVEVECIVPAKVRYKVQASSPEEAIELVKNKQAIQSAPILDLNKLKKISAKVFDYGTTLVKYMGKL